MTEKEMYDNFQEVWENMTMDKDRELYGQILTLLDDMIFYLRYDLEIDYPTRMLEVETGEFVF